VADQVFSTIQIPVNQWRWLPVTCLHPTTGQGITGVTAAVTDVSFIRSGELSVTQYVGGYDSTGDQLVGSTPAGSTTIKLMDSSQFPPENGKIYISGVGAEFVEYSYNNVSTGELVLKAATENPHDADTLVDRVDWVEVNATVAPGSYLLLLPPTILNKEDIFTYIVTDITGGGPETFERYFNTIDIVGSNDPVTMTTPSVATCKMYGFLVDVGGNAIFNSVVSARLLGTPATSGSLAISDSIVSTKTDANGYFEFSVAQGATVDVIIPDAGYRRTLTVPNTTLAKLFEIA